MIAAGTRARRERKPVTLKPDSSTRLRRNAYDAGFAAGSKADADEQTRQLTATLDARSKSASVR